MEKLTKPNREMKAIIGLRVYTKLEQYTDKLENSLLENSEEPN